MHVRLDWVLRALVSKAGRALHAGYMSFIVAIWFFLSQVKLLLEFTYLAWSGEARCNIQIKNGSR
jgi:hypothetical protein